ncbi:MAG TPA: hypothetical protein P5315_12555 [Clostridia bacterium]|nr:hypothetical protein [Clostridia bacterium]
MRKFFRILRSIWVPLVIVIIAAYIMLGMNVIPVRVMVDEMIRTANAGMVVDDYYSNYKLGIQFYTPPVDDGTWRPMTYQEQFTRQPYYVLHAAKAEFAVLEPADKPYPDFIFKAHYDAIKTSKYKNETSEELAQRLRNDHVREIISGNRDDEGMFDKSFVYSDIEPALINGNIYYKYTSYDIDRDINFLTYVIRVGDFGFRFMFYGQGEEIDMDFVNDVMSSVVYTEQDFTVEYQRKTVFD